VLVPNRGFQCSPGQNIKIGRIAFADGDIAAELAKQGHFNKVGKVFSPSVITSMLAAKP
jgi:hypothetical protein